MLTNKKMSDKLQYRYLFLTVGAKTKQKDILLSPLPSFAVRAQNGKSYALTSFDVRRSC